VNSLQFVTYEQLREDVSVSEESDSCDNACQTVYAEWPSTASYGERSFKRARVDTELDRTMRALNAAAPQVDNVLFMKPQKFGKNRCRCFSLQNRFVLGVDAAKVAFTHSYNTDFMSGSSKTTDKDVDPTSFMLAEKGDKPFIIMEKGKTQTFSIQQALEALGSNLDTLPVDAFYMNGLCPDGVCPPPYNAKPFPRITGASIDIRTEYYSHRVSMPKLPGFQWIADNYEPPYAIHVFRLSVDWTSRGSSVVTISNTANKTAQLDTYRYGISVKIAPAGGVISKVNYNVILNNLVNFVVLMGFPGVVMSVIVFYGCGKRSKLLRRGKRQVLSLETLYRSFAFNALVADKTFQDLDIDGDGMLTRNELFEVFKGFFMPKLKVKYPDRDEMWLQEQVYRMVGTLSETFARAGTVGTDGEEVGISREEFIRSCTLVEPLDYNDLINKVVDADADAGPIEGVVSSLRRRLSFNKDRGADRKVAPDD